jgi:ankyrin repeat protein
LMAAALSGSAPAVDALLKGGADPNTADATGGTALTYAAAGGQSPVVSALLAGGAKPSPRDLVLAAGNCREAAVETMLAAGVDVNAAANGTTPLMAAAADGCAPVLRGLLARGADAKAVGPDGSTALVEAAFAANPADAVRVLAATDVDVNAADGNGRTALMGAAMDGNPEVVQLLLDRGADLEKTDSDGRTAWMYAAMGNHQEVADIFRKVREASGR